MCGSKAGEMVSFGTDSSSNDSLSFLLRRTNQGLSSVLVNARCALEILQKFLREKENGGGGGGGNATGNKAAVSSVTLTVSAEGRVLFYSVTPYTILVAWCNPTEAKQASNPRGFLLYLEAFAV